MADSRDENVTWLTQEAYDRLKAEYEYLSGPGRVDIAKKIEAAREEGDLKENGGYHAAKDEQGKMEAPDLPSPPDPRRTPGSVRPPRPKAWWVPA